MQMETAGQVVGVLFLLLELVQNVDESLTELERKT